MKDPTTGKRLYGRTRWRRFGLLLAPAFVAVFGLTYGVMAGFFGLNLAISGVPFYLSASSLSGSNFVQYALPDQVTNSTANGLIPALEAQAGVTGAPGTVSKVGLDGKTYSADTYTVLNNADINNLAQTICVPLHSVFPLVFDTGTAMKVSIAAGGAGYPDASTTGPLVVQAPALTAASATFTNIIIGQDASNAITQYGYKASDAPNGVLPPLGGAPGLFSQAADKVTIGTLKQVAVGTEAGSFTLPGLQLSAGFVTFDPLTGVCGS